MKTSRASAPATAPGTWPLSAILPSTWCDKLPTSDPSSGGANEPLGTRNICSKSSARFAINLDSLPCSFRGADQSAAEGDHRGWSLGGGVKKMNMLAATMVKDRK